jgi:hypothetical protein
MPVTALIVAVLAAAAQPAPPASNDVLVIGRAGIPFISPMGEPIRARKPGEDTLARWFSQADRNHDGFLTSDEMVADAERFFAILDADHDGQIDPEELIRYEWKVAPEIQVNSRDKRIRPVADSSGDDAGGTPNGDKASRHRKAADYDDGPQGAARYSLLNMPEPVTAADANLDRAVSLEEFRQAATTRFGLLDHAHAGRLNLQQLEALVPPIPTPGKHRKHRADEADTRIGVPLPPGN